MLNLLQRNLSDCPKQSNSTASLSFVRPLIEYSSCVWDPQYDSHVLELEKVQHRAARWLCYNYNSVTALLSQLHWHSLQDRRKYAKLTLFHNAIYHNTALEIPEIFIIYNLFHI